MNRLLIALFTLVLVACAKREALPGDSVAADGAVTLTPPRLSTAPRSEPLGAIESRLFPPELVMEHQGAIGITPTQRDAILKEVEKGQTDMLRLQWELHGEKEKLLKQLDAEKVDEQKTQEVAAQVMDRETKIKGAHLSMLVRVKNLRTREQQKKLRALREAERPVKADAGPEAGG